jgi:hypothetical protein
MSSLCLSCSRCTRLFLLCILVQAHIVSRSALRSAPKALFFVFIMAHCDMCRGTFEIIATCRSGLTFCMPCWRFDADDCSEPLTIVDPVIEVYVYGDSGGPDGEVHGCMSGDNTEAEDAVGAEDTPHDVEMISQFSGSDSETDFDEAMMLGEPEPEVEPENPNQEPECEDNLLYLVASALCPVLVVDSSGMSTTTELMPGEQAVSVDDSADFGSDSESAEDMAVESASGGPRGDGRCEIPCEKRRRLG